MYNGIGLTTPRGSGTNGYIQTNKFFIKPRSSTVTYDADAPPAIGGVRKPNKDILEHDRKRRIELRLLSLREALADQGYTEDEVEEKVSETRKGLEEEEAREKDKDGDRAAMPPPSKRISDTQSHQIAARKQKQLEVFRAALGIKQGFESSDHEHQEESQQDKSHSSENEKCDDEKAQDREKGSGSRHFNKNGKQLLDKVRGGEDFKDLKQHGGENKHGNNSTNDSMEDGEIRSSVTNMKKGPKHQKGNNKDDSDSDSYSGKKQKRRDSDSESDRDARVKKKQLGNNLTKSRRYDSDDSKSDSQDERTSRKGVVEKHVKTSKSHKTINSSHPNRRHDPEDSETDDDKKTRSKISEKHRKPNRRHDSEDSLSESEDEKNDKRKVIAGHSKPSSRSNKPIRGHDSENSQHADDEKKSGGTVLEIQREPSIRIKEHDTIIDKKIVVNDKKQEKSCRDQRTAYESRDMRSRRFLKKEAERDAREMYETNDRSSESDTDDEKKRRGKGLEKQRKPTSRLEFDSRYAHEKSKQRRHDSDYESSPSDIDDQKKTRGMLLEEQRKPSSRQRIEPEKHEKLKQRRHDSDYESSPYDTDDRKKTKGKLLEGQREPSSRQRIESDTNNKKKEVFNRDKHETRTAVGDAYGDHSVRSKGLVKETSGIYAEKKRLLGTDDRNSDSDSGRKNTAVVKHNTYKKRVNSVSGSSSSDYSSDTNSGDSSHSDDSSDYDREKHGMKKTGGGSVKRMDISKAKQGISSMTDKKNNKEVQTDHHRDGKIGRGHESWIDSTKIKQALVSSSRTERKNDKDVKIDQRSDDHDKRLHLGYQQKTERTDSFEPRRDGDRDGRGSREDRKRKVEDAGISDLSFRESRRPITDVELKARESREPGSYGRSQDYRREDYPDSNRYEDKHESQGRTKDEQRYDDTKRRRHDDSPQYVPRDRHARNHEEDSADRHARNHEEDSGRGRRR